MASFDVPASSTITSTNMLCDKCSNIHFKRAWNLGLPAPQCSRQSGTTTVYYLHHDSWNNLHTSASKGCHFCIMLVDRLAPNSSELSRMLSSAARGDVLPLFGLALGISGLGLSVCGVLGLSGSILGLSGSVLGLFGGRPYTDLCDGYTYPGIVLSTYWWDGFDPSQSMNAAEPIKAHYNGTTIEGNPEMHTETWQSFQDADRLLEEELGLEAQRQRYEDDSSTLSNASLNRAKLWLQACLMLHDVCERDCAVPLPTRVVDVDSDGDPLRPKIVLGHDRAEPYIALSYSWGQAKRYVNSRREDHSIPAETLPQNFKDAIEVTRALGYRYLWIDALCIVTLPDGSNAAEVQKEMDAMHTIYQNSTLTLFAAAAEHGDAGLAVERDPRILRPCSLDQKLDTGSQTISLPVSLSLMFRDEERLCDSIFSRGWVLQEEALSRRCLFFSSKGIQWECCERQLCEANSGITEKATRGGVGFPWSHGRFRLLRKYLLDPEPTQELLLDEWYNTVVEYSARSLSYESDVLRALSGLQHAFMKSLEGRGEGGRAIYLAGLWAEDLAQGLCWVVVSDGRGKGVSSSARGPQGNGFPTWSWASRFACSLRFRRWYNWSPRWMDERPLVFESASTTDDGLRDPDVDGLATVPNNRLKVRGPIKRAILRMQSKRDEHHDYWQLGVWPSWPMEAVDLETGDIVGAVALDFDPELIGSEFEVTCLLTLVASKYDGLCRLSGLALQPVDDAWNVFTRIGLLVVTKPQWIDMYPLMKEEFSEKLPPEFEHTAEFEKTTVELI